MTRTLTHLDAFLQRNDIVCAKCGGMMFVSTMHGGHAVRARCLQRHCEQYGLVGEFPNERISLLAVEEDIEESHANVTLDLPVKEGRPVLHKPKIGGTD